MCKRAKEFIMCRNCPQKVKGKPSSLPNGYYYDEINGSLILRECNCHINWRKEKDLQYKLERSNLLSDYNFSDYRGIRSVEDLNALKSMSEYFEKFKDKKMIYLYGPNGTQKTSMAQALGKELIKKEYTVQYILMQELLNTLLPEYGESSEAKKLLIKKYQEVDLLIIDEAFDKSKVTLFNSGYQIPFLDSFLRTRFDINRASILFISNKKPDEISSQGFSTSLQNFVVRNTRNSTLIFEDRYIEEGKPLDRLSLFK